ncbi:MFS transporter [Paraglaciecola aquimarina]|uniref:MFS transporter n=1 Tax=Paraglaciecola algarum TaxID=3050085 RepID=A0ABS9D3Z3_9ALTE|nr:MFS transporter [Paraglaciecola sp. G1-23]MCF2947130.1 MFS transporter [Paraglaciecola sp. G1-23]
MQTAALNINKPTRTRFQILGLIFLSVVINYMDRTNISVAAAALTDDLQLTSIQMGLIFSAFGWTYSVCQIPGGIVVDFVKARILYPVILVLWSAATLIQGLVSSFGALVGLRMAIGVFEAPSYPCNNKIVTNWFPENERASAIAIYTSGQFIGLAFLMPVLVVIQDAFGWRGLFIVSGLVGFVWAAIWYVFYRDPEDHKGANQAELDHIAQDEVKIVEQVKEQKTEQKEVSEKNESKLTKENLKIVFSNQKLWGIYIGQFCLGGTLIFFLTWFPTYLVEYRGLDFIKSGFLASIPFIAAFCGVLISGFFSDFLVRKGVSKEVSRKAPMIIGMMLSMFIIGANYTDDTTLIITFLSIAFFGNGLSSIAWIFVSLLAPKQLIGLVGGCMNAIGSLAGVIVPVVIGFLVTDGDFRPALFFIASLAGIGFCSYLFLVGKIERVTLPSDKAAVQGG